MPKSIRSIIVGMGGISRSMLRVLAEKELARSRRRGRRQSRRAAACRRRRVPARSAAFTPTSNAR